MSDQDPNQPQGPGGLPADDLPTNLTGRRQRYLHSLGEPTDLERDPRALRSLGYLFVVKPDRLFGNFFRIRLDAVIGTHNDRHIRLQDPAIEDPHARIRLEQDGDLLGFVLYDLGGRSGVIVNGQRVKDQIVIDENDTIQMGNHVFVFKTLMDDADEF